MEANKVLDPIEQAQEFQERLGNFLQIYDKTVNASDFCLDPDNVIVATPPKNGSTWILHVCHRLRMKGQARSPDFDDQLQVVYMFEQSEKLFGVIRKVVNNLQGLASTSHIGLMLNFHRQERELQSLEIKGTH